ncbi:hypothetical protein Ancab_021695 [Ancistrocladus abbreviatus]
MVSVAEVIKKFSIASMLMWIVPIVILRAFQDNWFPGLTHMSPHSQTLLSGFLAVISVNIVIVFYICMAMREPSEEHQPDPAFLANAKASLSQSKPPGEAGSSNLHDKQE